MAAQDYTSVVQQLYVSYFGRPADYYGLQSFAAQLDAMKAPKTFAEVNAAVQADKAGTTALSKLVNSFNSSAESAALYGTDNSQIGIGKFVNAIYQNVLGRDADKAGFDFWVQAITSGTLTKANAAASITQAALTNTSDQGKLDAKTVENKLAVATAFTTGLDTPAEITAFSGDAAAASARALLSSVNNTTSLTAYQASIDASIADIVAAANPGKTLALTDSVDTLAGTTGNDNFNATAETLTALDKIDGAGGKDTLVIADAGGVMNKALPAGVSISNVEKLVVNTAGSLGQVGTTAVVFDVTGAAGLTDFTATAAGSINTKIADTTNLTATNTGTDGVTVAGGKSVAVTTATTGAVNVTGAGLTSVSVKGGTVVTVDNVDAKAATAKGATLTAVTLDGIAGGATVSGASLTSVALNNVAAQTVTVNNATASHTLNLSANTVGTTAAGAVTVADAAATTVAITASGKSNLAVNAAAATAVTVNAADATTLNLANATKLASVDASASAGGVTLTNLASTVTSVTTGAGVDKVTLTTATKAATTTAAAVTATVSTGAGNDEITIATTGTNAYSVNAGEGNDKITVQQGLLVAGSTINGGAGDDTLVLGNNTAAFAAGDYAVINSLVSNVEGVQFQNAVGGIDASKVAFTSMSFAAAASTVTGVTTQTLSTAGTLTAIAAGYVEGEAYAGNLNVTATGAASAVSLAADAATVNVKASTANAAGVTIDGDLKTSLTVNLTNAANASSSPTGDNLSTATVVVNAAENVALKSVVLTGAGSVTINASASKALTTIDASKLGGTIANGTAKGDITGGLTFTGNGAIAETITLGSGKDAITVASTYEKMDTIVGFDAVKEGTTGASTTDVLTISASQLVAVGGTAPTAGLTLNGAALGTGQTSTAGISKLALTSAESTLDLAFVKAATASAASNGVVSFEFGGNTYLFADTNDNGTLDSSDFAVKLVGTVDVTAGFSVAPTA